MDIPERAYSARLTPYQFYLLAVMCRLSGSEGGFKASIAELCTQTGNVSDKTLRRALKALEDNAFIVRFSTKRANGYNGKDRYTMVDTTVHHLSTEEKMLDTGDRTSHGYVTTGSSDTNSHIPLVPSTNITNSYKLKELENVNVLRKKVEVPMRNYSDDGDDLAGFGLIEDKAQPQPKIRKSDPKTRGKRPEHEWTPMDVSAEFSFQVGRRFPLLPGTLRVKELSGALSSYRKRYNTNALIELELLRLFMLDENNFRDVGDNGPTLYKKFLASFPRNINKAREKMGLSRVNVPEIDEDKESDTVLLLTASDGKTFFNTATGKAQLKRYEQRLKENTHG